MSWQADLRLVEDIVATEVARLHAHGLPHLAEVHIRTLWRPTGGEPRYGEFIGIPVNEPPESGELAPECIIFAQPLVADFGRGEELEAEVRITLLHELGHALGMDEDDLERIGLG